MAPKKKVVGTVDIPLQDYLDLVSSGELSREKQVRLAKISEQLEIFLSFLVHEEFFREAINQFNSQSSVCEIHIVDGRVKIDLPDK
ncbi:hypothetical protein LCGC14_3169480 [marine sediment metagenome]|uniref:Uncharacterized protein n=1 Tax=marine sediment metagenome TaxID=412755 RepID=A0A0F8XL52_9ZZZZ